MDEETINCAFDLLAGQRRRYALRVLREADDGVASVDDIADRLLAHDPDATDKERVLVALHHQILPKLDDASIIDFDRRTDTARYRGNELVEDLLDTIADWES